MISVDLATKANIDFSIDHDNAEADAVEGNEPNMQLLLNDADYCKRYVGALLKQYRQALVDLSLCQDGYITIEQLAEPMHYAN